MDRRWGHVIFKFSKSSGLAPRIDICIFGKFQIEIRDFGEKNNKYTHLPGFKPEIFRKGGIKCGH